MKKISIAILLLAVFGFTLHAAEPEFKVIAVKGNAQYKKSGRGSWLKITTGSKFYNKDKLLLKGDAYLGMVHKTGRTYELTKPATYKVSTLSKKVSAKQSDVNKRMADYVFDEMSDVDDLLAQDDYHDDMGTLGSVERAVGGDVDILGKAADLAGANQETKNGLSYFSDVFASSDEFLNSRIPRNSYLIDSDLELSWYSLEGNPTYKIIIKNRFDKNVFEKKTKDTVLKLDMAKIGLMKDSCYWWHISTPEARSSDYCILWLSEENGKDVYREVNSLNNIIGQRPGALDYLIMAKFYDEQNIVNRAFECYEKAVAASHGVDNYKKMFAKFLKRKGLYAESDMLLGK